MVITSYTVPNKVFQVYSCAPIHVSQCNCPTLNSQANSFMTRSVCHEYIEMWRTERNGAGPTSFLKKNVYKLFILEYF